MKSGLAQKTLILMAAGVAVLIAIAVASLLLSAKAKNYADDVRSERELRTTALFTYIDLLNAETGQRGFLLTGKEMYLAPYVAVAPEIARYLKVLKEAAPASSVPQEKVAALTGATTRKIAEIKQSVDAYQAGNKDEALRIVRSDQGRELMDQIRGLLSPIIASAENRINSRLIELDDASHRLVFLNVVGGLVLMALAAAAFYIISRNTLDLVRAQRNIEELNRGLEERVNERTTDLTRANDEIQRFAYIVSHDLRAPLVNIVGFTSELETGTATLKTYFEAESPTEEIANEARTAAEQEIPEALQFIRASTTKMDRLIGSILKLSREGRRQLKRERVDLTTLIEATVASVNHQIESAGTEVRIEAPLPSVVADRLALEQIFGNLIDNAIKYLSPNRQGLIIVTGEEFGGRVKIRVADNGRGIDKADSDRIFELFRRAGQQNKPGEGVGLAHVRALARRLGGDVGVTSELGIGSTFEVDLPKKANVKSEDA